MCQEHLSHTDIKNTILKKKEYNIVNYKLNKSRDIFQGSNCWNLNEVLKELVLH